MSATRRAQCMIVRSWTAALIGATLAGCAGASPDHAGAPPSTPAGPTVMRQESLPPLVSRVTSTRGGSGPAETAMQELTNRIDEALARAGNPAPAAQVTTKAAAGDQLQVAWVFGSGRPDSTASRRIREQVLVILDAVRAAQVTFGTVLLMATGGWVQHGSTTVSLVLRAKFSQGLVARTDWAAVSPTTVLGMCDDKPAVIAAGYR